MNSTRHYVTTVAVAILLLAFVGLAYWPVSHAGFVWVDKIIFHNNAGLRFGDGWRSLVFRNFYEWVNYFRPLVVALFTLEVRAFDAAPGPMHLVSLSLHLGNTLLVAMLAHSLMPDNRSSIARAMYLGFATLVYGLHPALIEPVVWICCQAELVVTFFVLAALLFGIHVRQPALRSVAIAVCFFLAACAKETAIVLPFLLLLFDWMRHDGVIPPADRSRSLMMTIVQIGRSQALVYAGVIVAGIAYLALRYWALGVLVRPMGKEHVLSVEHVQTASYLYLTYWRILIWPMIGLGPVHEINARQFALIDANSLLRDALALLILAWGLRATWKRAPIGALICGFTLALVPTLHIIPVAFDDSLYHERYAMLAIAITCAWLPKVIEVATLNTSHMRAITLVGGLVGTAWLGLATANIRVTLPLWSDEVRLWQWVLRDNPNSMRAKDHLLSTYLERSDLVRAQALADEFIADNSACPNCLLNAANLALLQQDSERAELALKKTKDALARSSDSRSLQSFILATGQLRELQNNPTGAEDAYRDAIKVEPTDPLAHMNLALLLARQGQTPEAREAFAEAEALFAPEERGQRREEFERTVVASRPASNSSSQ